VQVHPLHPLATPMPVNIIGRLGEIYASFFSCQIYNLTTDIRLTGCWLADCQWLGDYIRVPVAKKVWGNLQTTGLSPNVPVGRPKTTCL